MNTVYYLVDWGFLNYVLVANCFIEVGMWYTGHLGELNSFNQLPMTILLVIACYDVQFLRKVNLDFNISAEDLLGAKSCEDVSVLWLLIHGKVKFYLLFCGLKKLSFVFYPEFFTLLCNAHECSIYSHRQTQGCGYICFPPNIQTQRCLIIGLFVLSQLKCVFIYEM